MKYVCWYSWGYARRCVVVDRFDRCKDGFWVNSQMEFTFSDDARYWIPPGQVLFIEKVAA
jgi:hypothetical protein